MTDIIDSPDKLQDMRDTVETRIQEEIQKHPAKDEKPKLDLFRTQACIESGDLGAGIMFADQNREKVLVVKESGEFRRLNPNGIWELDHKEAWALSCGVQAVRDKYLEYGTHLDKQAVEAERVGNTRRQESLRAQRKIVSKSVKTLFSFRAMRNCLAVAQTQGSIRVSEDQLDSDPYEMAFPNGRLDLKAGRFHEGPHPEKYFTLCCGADFKGVEQKHESTLFNEIMLEIHNGSDEIVAFLQRYFGMALIGLVIERKFLILYGSGGQNGKGLITAAISNAMGTYAGTIPSEMLMATRGFQSSSGPRPDLMLLKSLRAAFASETEEGGKGSAAQIKLHTGGDPEVARRAFDRHMQSFEPSHSLVLLTNHRPHVSSDDKAFWERVLLVPYELSFVDREPTLPTERRAKKNLPERLKKEASGILTWLVRGCLQYQKQGLAPPPAVIEGTAQYQRDEDFLADFIEQCLEIDEFGQIGSKEAYDSFREWSEENISKKYVISNKKFSMLFEKRFEKKKTSKKNIFLGVRLKSFVADGGLREP